MGNGNRACRVGTDRPRADASSKFRLRPLWHRADSSKSRSWAGNHRTRESCLAADRRALCDATRDVPWRPFATLQPPNPVPRCRRNRTRRVCFAARHKPKHPPKNEGDGLPLFGNGVHRRVERSYIHVGCCVMPDTEFALGLCSIVDVTMRASAQGGIRWRRKYASPRAEGLLCPQSGAPPRQRGNSPVRRWRNEFPMLQSGLELLNRIVPVLAVSIRSEDQQRSTPRIERDPGVSLTAPGAWY